MKPSTIPADILYAFTIFFAVLILLILITTSFYLHVQKKHYLIRKKVQEFFDQWLSRMLLDDFSESAALAIPDELRNIRKNRIARQYAINQLINTKKNLVGTAARNVIYLYEQLGLKSSSLSKINSFIWYKKAKGIYELYMMEQKDMQNMIHPYTNSGNEYIRVEAQTAVLAFSGFGGLGFLNTLTRSMNSWQQVKLLEQLYPLDPGNFEQLPLWLVSPNDSVVIFALKLAEIYQQLQVKETVMECLTYRSPQIREQAIKTLKRIGDETTAAALVARYPEETPHNRKAILQTLEEIASDQDKPFLESELDEADPSVKLQVARIIAKCCTNGTAILQQKAIAVPVPYQQIFLHVKSELAR